MNTADRSIALLDTALRRRFEFEELQPDYSVLHSVGSVDLGAMLKKLNENVEFLYDRDHTIGHAYFINVKSLADLDVVFRRKVIPLLQEYFYEDLSKVRFALNELDANGGFFIKEKISAPKGFDGYDEKFRYTMKGEFQKEAFINIYA
jgi:5-methylcytosine-specific restriction protein B